MRIPYLRALLRHVETQTPLWRLPDGSTRNVSDFSRLVGSCSRLLNSLHGRRVAIRADRQFDLATLLVLLDGTCQQLFVLPGTFDDGVVTEMIHNSETDLLLTTGPSPNKTAEDAAMCIDIDDLWAHSPAVDDVPPAEALATRWVLPTSGTTGTPKLVSHTLRSLTRSLKHDFTRGTDFVWGSLYGLTSFAGLQVFLQSWCAVSTFVISDSDQTLDDRVRSLTAGGCNALSATPTMWRRLLMSHVAELAALRLKQITLGGEIADQPVLDALRNAFPNARITHIYASTEAGVGFAVKDGMAGFPATYLDSPPGCIQISVDDRQHLLVLPSGDRPAYLATDLRLHGESSFIDTGDLVERKGDRYEFLGRADGMINVGGDKVYPEEVERFLLGCDGVKFARVSGRKSSLTGSLVEADVVADTSHARDAPRFRAALLAQCRAGLAHHKVPAILNIVDSIELTALGKVQR